MRVSQIIFIGFLCIVSTSLFAQNELITWQSTYKYFVGKTEPDANWNTFEYSDTAWASGYSDIGYGHDFDSTKIDTTTSLYLRIPFDSIDKGLLNEVSLMIFYSHGFVAYINGVEIARSNLGAKGDFIAYNQLAERSHSMQTYDYCKPLYSYWIDKPTVDSIFKDGDNVLAIQIHNIDAKGAELFCSAGLANMSKTQYSVWNWENRGPKYMQVDSSSIPIIVINTEEKAFELCKTRYAATMDIFSKPLTGGPSSLLNAPTFSGKIGIKTRGESSGDMPKKSYELETQDALGANLDTALLGMPSENDWILYGPFSERSLIRNALAYDMSRKLGHWAPRYVYCEVIMNGEFHGLYMLMETIKRDKNRVNVKKLEATDTSAYNITGGFIIRYDKGTATPGTNFQLVYPEEEVITEAQLNYIKLYMDSVKKSCSDINLKDPIKGFRSLIDVNSFIDFTLLNELGKNPDAYLYSTYLHKNRGSDLDYGPLWDFDMSFGNTKWQNANKMDGWQWNESQNNKLFHKSFFKDTALVHDFEARWRALRQNQLHTDTINKYIDSLLSYLQPAIDRNYSTWLLEGKSLDFWGTGLTFSLTYDTEIPNLKKWISNRAKWMDAAIDNIYYPYNYSAAIAEMENYLTDFNCLPNPFTEQVTLEYTLTKPTETVIEVYNLIGVQVYTSTMQQEQSGTHNHVINLNHIPAGSYILNVKTNNYAALQQRILKIN